MSKHIRLLICGDRKWVRSNVFGGNMIRRVLKDIGPENIECVIEGEAKGADLIAREEALALGITVVRFPAQWDKFGRGAGPKRNAQMLSEGSPTAVAAFHDNIEESKGTANMMNLARKARVPVAHFFHSMSSEAYQEGIDTLLQKQEHQA